MKGLLDGLDDIQYRKYLKSTSMGMMYASCDHREVQISVCTIEPNVP